MDIAIVVGDGLLASGGVVAAVIGLRRSSATQAAVHETKETAKSTNRLAEHNARQVAELADRDNVNNRIRSAVEEYASAHPGLVAEAIVYDAMRNLLDAIISANMDEDNARRPDNEH